MIRTITPIFSIVIALVIFFFYSKPMFAEMRVLQEQTAQYSDAVKKAQDLNTELSDKLKKKRSYDTESINRLNALVPESINEVKVLTDLSEIARSHNMLFGNINVTNSDNEKSDSTVPDPSVSTGDVSYENITNTGIAFSLIGTYDQFKSFLSDIERSLVLMEVTGITFTTGEGDLQQYEVSIQLFALPPSE